jgi:hypothetical protein
LHFTTAQKCNLRAHGGISGRDAFDEATLGSIDDAKTVVRTTGRAIRSTWSLRCYSFPNDDPVEREQGTTFRPKFGHHFNVDPTWLDFGGKSRVAGSRWHRPKMKIEKLAHAETDAVANSAPGVDADRNMAL